MSSVLTRLRTEAQKERERLDAAAALAKHKRDKRRQLFLTMRAFVEDLRRSVKTLDGQEFQIRGEFGTTELDWDNDTKRPEFCLRLDRKRYIQAQVIDHLDQPTWQYILYPRSYYGTPTAQPQLTYSTEQLQNVIISKLSTDFPDAFT